MKPSTIRRSSKHPGTYLESGKGPFRRALIVLFWLLLWQLAYWGVGKDVVLPSPVHTFQTLFQLILTKGFYLDVSATMVRVLLGILLSFASGLITAVAAYLIPLIKDILSFAVQVLKSTPVMAVIIFALLWLTSGNVPIFVCFLMCYPVVYTNVLSGLESLSRETLEMSQVYHIRNKDKIRYIYLPFVSPNIKSALSLITGLSWKTVVAAEVLSSPKFSMGYNLLNAKVYLETEALFAWIIAIVTLSVIFERIVKRLLFRGRRRTHHD